jgi:hypothetical protein
MGPMRSRLQPILRNTLVLSTTVLPLLAFVMAGRRFVTWIRTQFGSQFYIEHSYLGDVAFWLCLGMIGVLPSGWLLFRPQARVWWLGLPALVSLFMFIYPNAKYSDTHLFGMSLPPEILAARHVQHQLSQVRAEILQAVESGMPWRCISGPMPTQSLYRHQGAPLSYQRVCVDADQPMESLLSSSAPGTIYIAAKPGKPTIRLFATVLPRDMSDTASWLWSSFGRPGSFVLSLPTSGADSSPSSKSSTLGGTKSS